MKFLSLLFLIPAFLLESTLTTIPLIFIVLLCLTVVLKENWIFAYAFFFGVLLDLVIFKTVGTTSAYMITFIFLVLLYQRKFEISTLFFVLASSFIGSVGFLLVLGYNNSILFQGVLSSVIALIIFAILKRFIKSETKTSEIH